MGPLQVHTHPDSAHLQLCLFRKCLVLLRNGTRHPHPRVKDRAGFVSGADGKSCTRTAQRGRAAGTPWLPTPHRANAGLQVTGRRCCGPQCLPTPVFPRSCPATWGRYPVPGPLAAAAGARRRLPFKWLLECVAPPPASSSDQREASNAPCTQLLPTASSFPLDLLLPGNR